MKPAQASALATVLERPDIWRGDALAVAAAPALASGFAALDAELPGGGWPRGQLTELLLESEGIGELSLLLPALVALATAGKRVVMVAPPFFAHAPAWAAAGMPLEGLRWVFPRQAGDSNDIHQTPRGPETRRARDALWAGVEILRCGGVAATVLWLDSLFPRGIPANSLRRLHLAAGEGGGSAFLLRPEHRAAESSPAPLRLRLQAAGSQLGIHLIKRRGPAARHPVFIDLPRPARLTHALAGPSSARAANTDTQQRTAVVG